MGGKDAIAKENDVFEKYATVKALFYLCTNPPEMDGTQFTNIKDRLLDYSKAVTDDKLHAIIQELINKDVFEKSNQEVSEDTKHILLEMLVLIVVGKSEKFPSTTKLVFEYVKLIEQKKQFLENCFQTDVGIKDLTNCILLQVKGLSVDDSDIKAQECNCEDVRHDMLVEWLSGMYEVKNHLFVICSGVQVLLLSCI